MAVLDIDVFVVARPASVAAASAIALAFTACSSSSTPPRTVAAFASPSSVGFGGADFIPSPAAVAISGGAGFDSNVSVAVGDPTADGATYSPAPDGQTGTLTIYPISSGTQGASQSVTVTGGNGASVSVPVSQAPCTRPETPNLPVLTSPVSGATGVPTSTSITLTPQPTAPFGIHLILGSNRTLEVPIGDVPEPVISNPGAGGTTPVMNTSLSLTLPALPQSTAVRVQYYDDTCEPPVIIGSFTTQS